MKKILFDYIKHNFIYKAIRYFSDFLFIQINIEINNIKDIKILYLIN